MIHKIEFSKIAWLPSLMAASGWLRNDPVRQPDAQEIAGENLKLKSIKI
jgi:hypothetical protein